MSSIQSRRPSKVSKGGAALLIVLFLIILLTGLTVAFLSRSMTAVKVSSSSAGETKVGLLANSAGDIIIGDLKQEIAAGSTAATYSGGTNTVYTPRSSQTMIPFQSGVPATNAATYIPNLISRSVRSTDTSGTAPYVAYTANYTSTNTPPNRAADDTGTSSKVSTTTPSLNGRYISLAQWNSHYLIPRATSITAGSTNTDSTPISSFEAPDWVVVTRGGANKVTWNSTLADSTLSNTNYVVGRYAYAVYNEGGLLDMNAAGYPADTTANGPNGLTTSQSSLKGPLPLADLTKLTAGTTSMTQAQINNIVGWRNYASANLSSANGSYGNFSFTPSNGTNWLNNVVLNNTNGFMKVVTPTGFSGTQTDQAFLSRQQLISMAQSLAISPDFLQYLGTFSRALEQPSFVPNSNRPSIIAGALPDASTANSATGYLGNNTYVGGESAINMTGAGGFLSVRVGTGFTRWNGTTASPGEPLVKTKFALSKLAMVTSTATTATVQATYKTASDLDPMLDRFGLTRASTSSPWVYNHGSASGAIMTLTQVAAANREPDMAELLKAAINAGSVGKAGPSGQGTNEQYRVDVSGDCQILQIMANLIDQQKTDNYPTWIQFVQNFTVSGTNYTRNIFGDQDLPYFYRWNYFNVTTKAPTPPLSSTDTVSAETAVGPPAVFKTFDHTITFASAGSPTTGTASMLIIPQVWNPHDANTPKVSNGPTVFRVLATSNPPGVGAAGAWSIRAVPAAGTHFDGAPNGITLADPPTTSYSTAKPLTLANNSWLQFTDGSNGLAFREPTILWRNNYPTGVTLSGISRTEDAGSLTGKVYYGILVGDTKVSWAWTDKAGIQYISQSSTMQHAAVAGGAGSLSDNITFDMQYQDPSGTWITYQETYLESTQNDFPSYTLFVNKGESSYSSDNRWKNPLATGVNAAGAAFTRQISGLFDPRTNRFTAPVSGSYTSDDPTLNDNPTLDATTLVNNAASATGTVNDAVLASNFVLMKTNRPTTARGQQWNYTTPCRGYDQYEHWYNSLATTGNGGLQVPSDAGLYDGLLSQNNPSLKIFGRDNITAKEYYYEDPDGVARRAMGGYVAASGSPAPTAKFGLTNITNQTQTIGLPLATAGTTFTNGIAAPSSQSQSRPIILHRAFRSVAEMSYAFRGTPWKNIDFFTPESGDTPLLDVFCINEPPPSGLIAGKVDLNTHQSQVLKALFSGAYRDEFANLATPPTSGTLPALSSTEATNLANTLVGITTSSNSWEGPLTNIGDIVGHFVYPDPGALTATDVYQYTSPANNTEYTYSGFTGALGASSSIWDAGNLTSSQCIQRFHESAIRPLADSGQVRVWNLLIDIVAQTGRYPKTATGLDQFLVDGQKRVWLHVAIDRYTGQVLDKQVEVVSQ